MAKLLDLLVSTAVNRRSFVAGLALLAVVAPLSAAALAQGKINEVPVDKLMAPDELSELILGNKDAKVTIVEYMSMSCPACADFHKTTLPKLKEKYIDTGKVRFVMREFPLNYVAAAGAMLVRCADDDAKAVALIDVLFEKQREWVSNDARKELFRIAQQAGFTKESFEKCLTDDKLLAQLSSRRDKADKEFGVDRTPSFFINGKRLRGKSFGIENFDKAIEPLLQNP